MISRLAHRWLRPPADLTVPRGTLPPHGGSYEPAAFNQFAEGIARFLGTARFIVVQTVAVITWVVLNSLALIHHWDPFPFILLNLVFSTQSAYAAPLILLAQNRQDDRDRASIERDREIAGRTQADTAYLIRELSAIRLVLADALTTKDLEDSMTRLQDLAANPAGPESHT
jgi:uncharacterized membrane protein